MNLFTPDGLRTRKEAVLRELQKGEWFKSFSELEDSDGNRWSDGLRTHLAEKLHHIRQLYGGINAAHPQVATYLAGLQGDERAIKNMLEALTNWKTHEKRLTDELEKVNSKIDALSEKRNRNELVPKSGE